MKIIENKYIYFIDGYLAGLNDIDGIEKREFIARAFLIKSNTINLEKNIKLYFDDMDEVKIIKKIKYSKVYAKDYFLEKMLLVNPFGILHKADDVKKYQDTLNNYRKYVVFHLCDYIDFVFEEEGVDFLTKGEAYFALGENKNQNFIVLVIRKNNISLFFILFRKSYNKKQFETWYKDTIEYHQVKTEKYRIRQERDSRKDDDICENGLTVKINRDIIEPLIKQAIEIGYFDEESKNILLKYFSNEKIIELEEVFCNK
jgi:hypothetical protein